MLYTTFNLEFMTREQAKELLPIIQAWAEGKNIQFLSDGEWHDINQADFTCYPDKYRIKPEPKYRPFKTQEECWNEMIKHQPFGWIRYDDSICTIQNIAPDGITVTDGIKMSNFYFEECFTNTKFADGAPFGIEK